MNRERTTGSLLLSFWLVALLLLLVALSLLTGFVDIDPYAAITALFSGSSGTDAVIIKEIRLPRTLMGILAGASL